LGLLKKTSSLQYCMQPLACSIPRARRDMQTCISRNVSSYANLS
jgi:hypothetical protein